MKIMPKPMPYACLLEYSLSQFRLIKDLRSPTIRIPQNAEHEQGSARFSSSSFASKSLGRASYFTGSEDTDEAFVLDLRGDVDDYLE
jgi:hypothetical protein